MVFRGTKNAGRETLLMHHFVAVASEAWDAEIDRLLHERQHVDTAPAAEHASSSSDPRYRIVFVCNSRAQLDEAVSLLESLPELQRERSRRSTEATIRFLEDKPEIFHHDSLAYHLLENARLRNMFISRIGALSSDEVAELGQSTAKNRAQYAHRLRTEGKIFAVEFRGELRYPAFQFGTATGKPKPIMKRVLELIRDEWSDWQLALWFITPTGHLDDRSPIEVMDKEPEEMLTALRKESGEVEF